MTEKCGQNRSKWGPNWSLLKARQVSMMIGNTYMPCEYLDKRIANFQSQPHYTSGGESGHPRHAFAVSSIVCEQVMGSRSGAYEGEERREVLHVRCFINSFLKTLDKKRKRKEDSEKEG